MITKIIGNEIINLIEVSSTNNYLAKHLKNNEASEGLVVKAQFQTVGRGHRENCWYSNPGQNILLSILLYPEFINPQDQFLISKTISLGIIDFLSNYIKELKIKWPNDIYYKNKKIAGILIENTIIGDRIGNSIVGIGLNVNQKNFPIDIPNAVSLILTTGNNFSCEILSDELLFFLDNRYKQLIIGEKNKINDEYLNKLYLLNEFHEFKTDQSYLSAKIIGVTEVGKLYLEDQKGKKFEFNFKEIEF